ncbi:MAG: RNHCP domain-containing protein [Candidatus Moranbacteria bacterium]|nr:RNHCP domain-containing protein [Candidatus Moranbacteria bacterium]
MKQNSNFICKNCSYKVRISKSYAIVNRNHCPKCLFSIHLDKEVAGDRQSSCWGLMKPIGLTFKKTKPNKYNKKTGELMLVQKCLKCNKISLNRLASDDCYQELKKTFFNIKKISKQDRLKLNKHQIKLLDKKDFQEFRKQILGEP